LFTSIYVLLCLTLRPKFVGIITVRSSQTAINFIFLSSLYMILVNFILAGNYFIAARLSKPFEPIVFLSALVFFSYPHNKLFSYYTILAISLYTWTFFFKSLL
jgi:hypothetical protein